MHPLLDSAQSVVITVLIQSSAILGTALVVGRCLRRNSSLRYAVLLSALAITMLSAAWVLWTPSREGALVLGSSTETIDFAPALPQPTSPERESLPVSAPALASGTRVEAPVSDTEKPAPSLSHANKATTFASPVAPVPPPRTPFPWRWVGLPLLIFWLSGSLFLAIRLLAGWRAVRQLVRESRRLPSDEARVVWLGVAEALGLGVPVERPIFLSSRITSPLVAGFLRPRLIVPEAMRCELASRKLRAVLAHETAHILRRDTMAGWMERLAQILLWPQPLLHVLLRMLDRSREEICDNYALAFTDRCSYGETLLALSDTASSAAHPHPKAVVMGLLRGRWSLEQRISEILNPNRNTMKTAALRHWIAPTAAIGTMALLIGGTRVSLAAPDDERRPQAESEKREAPRKEREERRDGERFEAQVRELRAAMREAAERGQEDRAHQFELRLKELHAHREHQERRAREEHRERGEHNERFEAQVRELRAAMREAAERGQEDRAHQLEIRLKELHAHREQQERRAREEHRERGEHNERFENQVRELRAAMRDAAERGQEDRAHQLEIRLKDLLASREHQERRAREERREGGEHSERFEAQVRELRAAIREAAERGQEDRAHQLEIRLRELHAHREREAHERAGNERAGNERAAHLERRLHEMSRHVEEMQRAMLEMQRELERLRHAREE